MCDNLIYLMEFLVFYEGVLGYYFQVVLLQELENMLMFQCFVWYLVYGEGWVFYVENLGKEMGFFIDFYQDFGCFFYEVF